MVGDRAAVDDCADDLGVGLGVDAQADQTVIDQDHAADAHVCRKVLVSYGSSGVVAHHFFCGQCKGLAFFEYYFAAFKVAQADLRPLGIKKCRHGLAHLAAHADDSAELGLVLLMCAV